MLFDAVFVVVVVGAAYDFGGASPRVSRCLCLAPFYCLSQLSYPYCLILPLLVVGAA